MSCHRLDRAQEDPALGNESGVGRFELPASRSQIRKSGLSGCVGLCRNLSNRSGLAGVMSAQTDTRRTGRHSPVLPELIHR